MDEHENPENWSETEPEYIDSSDLTHETADTQPAAGDVNQMSEASDHNKPKAASVKTKKQKKRRSAAELEAIVHTIVYMVIVLAVAVVLAIMMWFAADDVLALTKPDQEVTITLQKDESLNSVAQTLKDNDLINYKWLFILYGKFSHAEQKFGSGTFVLNQMFDYHAIVNGLTSTSDTRKTVTLTFPEGYSTTQIITMLAENDVCDEDELKDVCANYEFDYDFLKDIPYGESNRLEGFMFPDTYEFYVGDDAERVINKFLSNFDDKLTEDMNDAIDALNEDIRSRMEDEGSFTDEEIDDAMMDLYDVITVASLIEKEAGNDSERSYISSVIYNRLTTRVNEYLQIDATVEYALGEHKEKLTDEDLKYDSPYNTYLYKGLTPGPIANPGLSSIMAALYPEDTDYYFYAVNNSGAHEFFENYYQQQEYITTGTVDYDEDTPDEEAAAAETEENSDDSTDAETEDGDAAAEDDGDLNEDGEEDTTDAQ